MRRRHAGSWAVDWRVIGETRWHSNRGRTPDRRVAEILCERANTDALLAGWPYEYRVADAKSLASRLRWYTLR